MHRLVDVSEHQGDIHWKKVAAAGYAAAYVRVADGDHRDPFYGPGRVRALREAGLRFGPYYYGRVASRLNRERGGAAEARMALDFARSGGWGEAGDLRLAYDFEEANGQSPVKAARHLVDFIREYRRLMSHSPVLYTMPGFWASVVVHLGGDERALVRACPLWIAHWRVPRPTVPEPWRKYALWQTDDSGRVDGIRGPVDLNTCPIELERLALGSDREVRRRLRPRREEVGAAHRVLSLRDLPRPAGKDVEALQEALNERLAARGLDDFCVVVDGHYGELTALAARKALWLLGATRAVVAAATAGAVDVDAQAMIRQPDGRSPAALARARARRERLERSRQRRKRHRNRLSRNFHVDEFRCKDGTSVPQAALPGLRALCETVLEPMRERFGPGQVTSGYRTSAHNARAGGERNSQHVYDQHPAGVAADLVFSRGNAVEWADHAASLGADGVGKYPRAGFVHCDNRGRDNWPRARWTG